MDEIIQPEAEDVLEICKALLEKGLSHEEALAEVAKMAEEGKIAEEDLAKAKEFLEKAADDEKAEAERLFGLKFAD